MVRVAAFLFIKPQVLPVEEQGSEGAGGPIRGTGNGHLGGEEEGAAVRVPETVLRVPRLGPRRLDQGPDVRLIDLPVPQEEEPRALPIRGRQLVHAVSVQVHCLHVTLGPEEQGGRTVAGEGVIVVDLAEGVFGQLAVVGNPQAGLAEQVCKGLHAALRRPPGGVLPGHG